MSRVSTDIGLLKSRIENITYERDMAVALLQASITPGHSYKWEGTVRDFLSSIGKLTMNELPPGEQIEYMGLKT